MPRHQKVTQEQYFQAALDRLATHGAEGLTIGALCESLGVTSGSFYHYFGGWGGFVDALLAHWETAQTDRIMARTATEASPLRRLDVLRDEVLGLPHEAEAAIRAWSRGEPKVRSAQERVDERRIGELRAIIVEIGAPPRHARRLATMGLALLVGVQQLRRPVDVRLLRAALDELATTIREYAGIVEPDRKAGPVEAGPVAVPAGGGDAAQN